MSDLPEFKESVAWYHNYHYYLAKATKYIDAYNSLTDEIKDSDI